MKVLIKCGVMNRGMGLIGGIMVLFLFCGCSNEIKLVTESLQENGSDIGLVCEQNTDYSFEKNIPSEETKEEKVFVYVCGAVNEPGVYSLSKEDRIDDAVRAAGGLLENASRVAVNLAEHLSDGQYIYIPTVDEEVAAIEQNHIQKSSLVNINTAEVEELQSLRGIGGQRAQDIVTYREKNGTFSSIEELMNVSGIGQTTFEKIRDRITI